jgi:hypothetical protein
VRAIWKKKNQIRGHGHGPLHRERRSAAQGQGPSRGSRNPPVRLSLSVASPPARPPSSSTFSGPRRDSTGRPDGTAPFTLRVSSARGRGRGRARHSSLTSSSTVDGSIGPAPRTSRRHVPTTTTGSICPASHRPVPAAYGACWLALVHSVCTVGC